MLRRMVSHYWSILHLIFNRRPIQEWRFLVNEQCLPKMICQASMFKCSGRITFKVSPLSVRLSAYSTINRKMENQRVSFGYMCQPQTSSDLIAYYFHFSNTFLWSAVSIVFCFIFTLTHTAMTLPWHICL